MNIVLCNIYEKLLLIYNIVIMIVFVLSFFNILILNLTKDNGDTLEEKQKSIKDKIYHIRQLFNKLANNSNMTYTIKNNKIINNEYITYFKYNRIINYYIDILTSLYNYDKNYICTFDNNTNKLYICLKNNGSVIKINFTICDTNIYLNITSSCACIKNLYYNSYGCYILYIDNYNNYTFNTKGNLDTMILYPINAKTLENTKNYYKIYYED
ncbi:hypothetical protein AHEV_067 [Adoxophyes honmai entomopoxvirus 'L']|uniref:Uncharacterized protein n=1 Tax=Adoxophyes honmai entomopoxvirus 'L' TaxID=1293540 RepID=A0A916KP00_9POXV|nr:hypothetical protein AHEV_067 [Adoxophyes honmai entomopoxvirus 'L']CCU55388.1 hypothetical protein AHEV_067 [Adoxophyes honmai entomopoxvirus 'L']